MVFEIDITNAKGLSFGLCSPEKMEGGAAKHRSKVDPYGFERADDFDYNSYEEFMAAYLSVLARRASKWSVMVGANGQVPKTRKLKRYVRKGIPAEHRTMIWMYSSGAEAKMHANPGLYQKLLAEEHDPKLVETIELDIPRTFPENIYFQDTPSDPNAKRKPLFNILVALGHKNSTVGYCQGLNFIAGILLLVVKDEEKVFWLMDILVNDILPEYHTPDMASAKVDYEVLGELVKEKMPNVHQHFSNGGVMWSIICAKWFICIYADVLPIETTLRVWDCLFYEGAKIIFRVGLAMIKTNQAKFLVCRSFTEIMDLFKEIPKSKEVLNCHQFMQSIFKEPGSLPWAKIQKLRLQCKDKEPS